MDDNKIIIEPDEDNIEESQSKKNMLRVLAFKLGDETYCVEIHQVKTVVKPGQISRVPNTPEFVLGIMNLRGEVLSIIDIRYFFGLEANQKPKDLRVLVTDAAGANTGIMVDGINEAIDIDPSMVQPPLATLKTKTVEYTKGQIQIGDDILILLDLEKILRSEDIDRLRKGE